MLSHFLYRNFILLCSNNDKILMIPYIYNLGTIYTRGIIDLKFVCVCVRVFNVFIFVFLFYASIHIFQPPNRHPRSLLHRPSSFDLLQVLYPSDTFSTSLTLSCLLPYSILSCHNFFPLTAWTSSLWLSSLWDP